MQGLTTKPSRGIIRSRNIVVVDNEPFAGKKLCEWNAEREADALAMGEKLLETARDRKCRKTLIAYILKKCRKLKKNNKYK